MKYSDYQTIVEKEYERNRKNIFTCYFFILLSVIFFAVFFLSVRELPVAGAAFLLDFAAAVYALRAFKGLHPYWEMQLAIKAKEEPTEMNVGRFIAGVEFAGKKRLPSFHGRAPEIFAETFTALKKSGKVSVADLEHLKTVLKAVGVTEL